MANKRVLYAAEALFVGPSPATGVQPSGSIIQLQRIQSIGYDWSVNREDVRQFGVMAPIDRIALDLPTVSLSASYLATNVRNESGIGLYVGGDLNALTNILNGTESEKNYFVRDVPDGNAAAGYAGTDGGVMGIGNGVLASYQAQGAVGSFPTAQFSVQGLDASWSTTSSAFDTPAVTPSNGQPITGIYVTLPVASTGLAGQSTALRPGDITVDLDGAGIGVSNICIQSYNIQMDLNLEPIICLGSKYPTSREPQFPVNCSFSVEANMVDFGTGRLASLFCNEDKFDITVTLRAPTCDTTLGAIKARYSLKQATLDSESFNSTIGPAKTVTLNFTAPIGAANETGVGFFISGVTNG